MPTQITTAVIPQSLEHLTATLRTIATFSHDVQIDIVDGKFVPFTSWPYIEKKSAPSDLISLIQDFVVEVDLMINEPEAVIREYVDAGVGRVVVHLESILNLHAIVALKNKYSFELGFSVGNDTDLRALTSVIHMADYVQCMGIAKIGSQGQPFDTRVLARIAELKSLYPGTPVSVDGSVNLDTLPLLIEAGAERFVAGSSILGADEPDIAYNKLLTI